LQDKKFCQISTPLVFLDVIIKTDCGSKTWSLTFREEKRLRMSDNKAVKNIFEPGREEIIGLYR
jgi:hypothetical protein